MPLYDFKCLDCRKIFELSLTLAEREGECAKKLCPACSSTSIEQVISFSGGGLLLGGTIKATDIPPDATTVGYPGFDGRPLCGGGDTED